MTSIIKNYENHKLEYIPQTGLTVWLWDDEGATSLTVHDVRYDNGTLEISLGLYLLNRAGGIFERQNVLYSNPGSGKDLDAFKRWGFSEEHLKQVWHKASSISYPDRRQIEQRFSFPMPYEMLLDEIEELKGKVNGLG